MKIRIQIRSHALELHPDVASDVRALTSSDGYEVQISDFKCTRDYVATIEWRRPESGIPIYVESVRVLDLLVHRLRVPDYAEVAGPTELVITIPNDAFTERVLSHDVGRPIDSPPDAFERWRNTQPAATWAKHNLDDVAFGWNAAIRQALNFLDPATWAKRNLDDVALGWTAAIREVLDFIDPKRELQGELSSEEKARA